MNKVENLERLNSIVTQASKENSQILLAIDGRCAAGKTSLAAGLQEIYKCNVIHMDHFFLRGEQRTEERLNTPGENIDHERFREEVLIPLRAGKVFSYRPYDCGIQKLAEPVWVEPNAVNIIEGSYSCHEKLWDYYDLRIFLTVNPEEQIRRIRERNGSEILKIFENKWIPLEENYFAAYKIAERCDYCFET